MHRTGIVFSPECFRHETDEGHPEHVSRLEAIGKWLKEDDRSRLFTNIPSRPATREEIEWIHSPGHYKRISETQNREVTFLTPDTIAGNGSFPAALHAVGGLLEAVTMVARGDLDNAFALIRPPGHHAEKDRAMGFCLFNNIALAAMHARINLSMDRVLIIDWDVHHGNGTQHAFEKDRSVFFFSIHQKNHFPGTGLFTDAGFGGGDGFTMNLPIPGGYGDSEYAALFETLLFSVALEFQPDLILVSAGFDAHKDDPMGSMKLSKNGFQALTRIVLNIAKTCCNGKLVLCLEGGYNSGALAESVGAVLLELSGNTEMKGIPEMISKASRKKVKYAKKRCLHVHRRFWKSLED